MYQKACFSDVIIPPENNSITPLSVTFSSWSFDYLKMNFLGLLTPPDTAFLLFLLHSWTACNSWAASTLSPFTPSQALGCVWIPSDTAPTPQGQRCPRQCQDSSSRALLPELAAVTSAGPHLPVFPCVLGLPSISSQGSVPHFDLLASEGDADAFSLPDMLSLPNFHVLWLVLNI